jgi:hypothetical protein
MYIAKDHLKHIVPRAGGHKSFGQIYITISLGGIRTMIDQPGCASFRVKVKAFCGISKVGPVYRV